MAKQLELPLARTKTRKRRRIGRSLVSLGRKPKPQRAGFVSHGVREKHDERCPVHVTMRRVAEAPSFRAERVANAIMQQLARATRPRRGELFPIRVIEFSIQHDHLHLMLEGKDRQHLARQTQKLFSRIALAVNAVAGRCGKLFRDRHHRHELKTPTEVRRALVYILFNSRRHAGRDGLASRAGHAFMDPLSSTAWFSGWSPRAGPSPTAAPTVKAQFADITPIVEADTWLARVGWRRAGGPIRFDELPHIPR